MSASFFSLARALLLLSLASIDYDDGDDDDVIILLRFVTPFAFSFFPLIAARESCSVCRIPPPLVDVGSNESLERVSGTGDTRSSFISPY